MWKWLHPYANPEVTYHFTGKIKPWLSWASFILLTIGLVWALLFAPADYQQGDSFRIFYIHVPSAMLSMGIYVGMAIAALSSLVWQLRMADASAAALAPIGAVFTAIALITGASAGIGLATAKMLINQGHVNQLLSSMEGYESNC